MENKSTYEIESDFILVPQPANTRYKRIAVSDVQFQGKIVECELPPTAVGRYIVDDSHFEPVSEALKKLGRSPLMNGNDSNIGQYYDFPDGKDTGMKIPISRRRGADLAEVSTEVRELTNKVNQEFGDAKRRQEYESKLASIGKAAGASGDVATQNV